MPCPGKAPDVFSILSLLSERSWDSCHTQDGRMKMNEQIRAGTASLQGIVSSLQRLASLWPPVPCGFHVTPATALDTSLTTRSYALDLAKCIPMGEGEVPLGHFKNICQAVWWKVCADYSSKKMRLLLTLPGHGVFLNFL